MKRLLIIICLFLVVCCNNIYKQNNTNIATQKLNNSIIYADTTMILGECFIASYHKNDTLYIINANKDTINQLSNLHPNIEFIDFNNDGQNDLISHFPSNIAEVKKVFLFNKEKGKFQEIVGLKDFPAPKHIKKTNYYYSYSRAGCHDLNWTSYLFYIDVDNTIVPTGFIFAKSCEDEPQKMIEISKIIERNIILVNKIPISILGNYEQFKHGFLQEYWGNNYSKFQR